MTGTKTVLALKRSNCAEPSAPCSSSYCGDTVYGAHSSSAGIGISCPSPLYLTVHLGLGVLLCEMMYFPAVNRSAYGVKLSSLLCSDKWFHHHSVLIEPCSYVTLIIIMSHR